MGSLGVKVYTGNLLGTQAKDIIEGRVAVHDRDKVTGEENPEGRIPDFIRVYADNNDTVSLFTIRMENSTPEQREAFLNYWVGKTNIHTKNANNSYTKAFNDAKKEIDPHTGNPISDEDAREVANIARANTLYRALDKAFNKHRDEFGNMYVEKTRRGGK